MTRHAELATIRICVSRPVRTLIGQELISYLEKHLQWHGGVHAIEDYVFCELVSSFVFTSYCRLPVIIYLLKFPPSTPSSKVNSILK